MGEHKTNPVAVMAESRPRCATCVHWYRDNPQVGHCRAIPPTAFFTMQPDQLRPNMLQSVAHSHWAPVRPDQWCGQHPDFMQWFVRNRGQTAELDRLEQHPTERQA